MFTEVGWGGGVSTGQIGPLSLHCDLEAGYGGDGLQSWFDCR